MAVRRACGSAAGLVPGTGAAAGPVPAAAVGVQVGVGDGVHVGEGVQVGAGAAARAGATGAAGAEDIHGAGAGDVSGVDRVPWAGGTSLASGASWAVRVSVADVTGAGVPIRRLAQAGLRIGRVRDWTAGRSAWPDLASEDSRSSRTQPESPDAPFLALSIGKGPPGSSPVSEASAPRGPSTTSVTNASRLSRMRPAASFLLVSPTDVRRQTELPGLSSPNFDSGGPDSLSGMYTCGCC
jgi:hypothetical protein